MWNLREWLWMGVTAVGVGVLTAAVADTQSLVAADDKPAVQKIPQAKWESGACVVTVGFTDEKAAEANGRNIVPRGNLPSLTLHARNEGSDAATLKFHLTLQLTNAKDRLSRVPRMGAPAWSQEYSLELKAGESRDVAIDPQVMMEGGSAARLMLEAPSDGSPASRLKSVVVLLNVSTGPAGTELAGRQP